MKDDTLLARWLSGEMDAQELETFRNSPDYASYERIRQQFSRLEPPQFDSNAMLHEVLRHEKSAPKPIALYRRSWFAAAAILIIMLGIGYALLMPTTETAQFGKTYAFHLPDDSEVILNAGSQAHYNSWNWGKNRMVTLDGEAYFKVAKGKKFSVVTPLGKVTVLGTQFDVRARGNRFEVICYEGKVWVQYQNKQAILTPQQHIVFTGASTSGILEIPAKEPGWMHGELFFSNESLLNVLAEIERQYNVKIATTAQSVQLFSGAIPGNDLDATLKVLTATYHLKIEKTANGFLLTPDNEKP